MNVTPSPAAATRFPPQIPQDARPASKPTSAAFHDVLGRSMTGNKPHEVRAAAVRLVSSALIMPVMKSLQSSPFGETPLSPGTGEKQFMPLLHTHLADRLTNASQWPIVDSIVRQLGGTR